MSKSISEADMKRLLKGSHNTAFRTAVMASVVMHYRSMHYKASKILCDCVVLNLLLNYKITPHSADEIITNIRRENKALYTLIEASYKPIEDEFIEYAKSVLGDEYEKIQSLKLRTANYIIYIISLDLSRQSYLQPEEVYMFSYSYDELTELKGNIPHYD